MTLETDLGRLEPDLLGVVRSKWRLIAVVAIALAILGFFIGTGRDAAWQATASVVVDDPRRSTLFGADNGTRPERYVETQIGILSSPAVAQKAREMLASQTPPITLTMEEMLQGSSVGSQESSDLISVSFTSQSARASEAAADAIITAYLELRRSESIEGFSAALSQLDESIAQSQAELQQLNDEIRGLRESSPFSDEIEQRYEAALARLAEIGTTADGEADPEAITEEFAAITRDLNAIETIARIEGQRPELEALLEEQSLAVGRLSDLITRRNEVSVDAELAGGGFVFRSEATAAERVNPGPRLFALTGFIIGAMLGLGLAYALMAYRRAVDSASEPELILQSPLLGAIPVFDRDVDTSLPVANAPKSRSTEAFRFVMAAIEAQLFRRGESHPTGRLVFVTSPAAQDGRSTLTANIAVAAAKSGRRVLVVDADFSTQGVSEILLPGSGDSFGITEAVIGVGTVDAATRSVPIVSGGDLSLMSRGSDLIGGQDIFSSREIADLLERVRDEYDLVLIDAPPLPQVGYATTLARLADRVLVVVRHGTQVSRIEELQRRLSLIQSHVMGYVYNRAPGAGEARRPAKPTAQTTQATGPGDESSLDSRLAAS